MRQFLRFAITGCLLLSTNAVGADQPMTPSGPHGKVIDLYNEAMDQNEFDVAEVLALGAVAKFGEHDRLAQVMLREARKAKIAAPVHVEPNVVEDWVRTYTKAYSAEKLFDRIEPGKFSSSQDLVEKLEAELGKKSKGHYVKIAPLEPNKILVVHASQEVHDELAKVFEEWED